MTVLRSSSGSWGYRVYTGIDPATGKRKRTSKFGFARKKDAEAAERQVKEALAHQAFVPNSGITFGEFAADWLQKYNNTHKESAYRVRELQVNNLLEFLDKIPLQDITKRSYQQLVDKLSARYKVNTVRGIHATARLIFKEARRMDLLVINPAEFAVLPALPQKIVDPENDVPLYLEKEQLQEFLAAAKKYGSRFDYPLFTLLAYTGLRIGEAEALCWEDIDFEAKTIKISKTLFNPRQMYNTYKLYMIQ